MGLPPYASRSFDAPAREVSFFTHIHTPLAEVIYPLAVSGSDKRRFI